MSEKQKVLVLIYSDGTAESFLVDGTDSGCEYWVRRRHQKQGNHIETAVVGVMCPAEEWQEKYDAEDVKYEREQREHRDRNLYEQLKQKYEGQDQ